MTLTLGIREVGDPILRQRARTVSTEELASPRVQLLIEMMRATIRDRGGVGLAAPQVGESLQVVVIEDTAELIATMPEEARARLGRSPIPFQVLVNPRLTIVDGAEIDEFEGCMSVGRFLMSVRRARSVQVEALDHRGAAVAFEASTWFARILLHEVDHLQGKLCVDLGDAGTIMTFENRTRFWKGMSPSDVRADLASRPG